MPDLKTIPAPNPEYSVRVVGDETVFLAPAGDQIYSLDPVGTFIWQQIDGTRTLADILAVLVDAYDVDQDEARVDLIEFVNELAGRGLVSLGPRGS